MLLSESDIDTILFMKFSSVSRQEFKLMRSDTLDFCAWYEQFGEAWPDSPSGASDKEHQGDA